MTPVATAPAHDQRGRLRIFWVEMAYLIGLLVVAGLLVVWPAARERVPASVGPIPIAVPWFGALGAVSLGLQGVFNHRDDWDAGYNLWHIARPLIGIVLAVVAYLAFIAGILATGNSQPKTGAAKTATDDIIYYVVGFIVGYREEVFRNLLSRLADVLLSSGDWRPTP